MRLEPIVLGLLIAMAGIFVTADQGGQPTPAAPTTQDLSASERLLQLSKEILKCADEVKGISDQTRGQLKAASFTAEDRTKLPAKVVFGHWKTAFCQPCEDWKRDEKPRFEAEGILVTEDDSLDEDCTAPQFTLCWCPDGVECNADRSNCTKCETFSGFLSLEKLREISARRHSKDSPEPAEKNNTAVKASMLTVASSLAEAKETGAQIVLGPGLHVERLRTVDGVAVDSPIVVSVRPPLGVRIPLDDNCKTVYSGGSTGSAGSTGTVSYSTSSWVGASSYPVPVSSYGSGGSYGGSTGYNYQVQVQSQPTTYYQPAQATATVQRRGCRIVNGVRVCN